MNGDRNIEIIGENMIHSSAVHKVVSTPGLSARTTSFGNTTTVTVAFLASLFDSLCQSKGGIIITNIELIAQLGLNFCTCGRCQSASSCSGPRGQRQRGRVTQYGTEVLKGDLNGYNQAVFSLQLAIL